MKAMLLAAGEGTRFRPHTLKKPKPALPLLNVPLGLYSFDHLKAAGVDSLVVNTFHLPQEIRNLYKNQNWFPVDFTDEKERILGNGGGLWNAKIHFMNEEDFFLLNSDEVIATENAKLFDDLKQQHQQEGALSTLLVMEHPEVGKKFGGVWINAAGRVIGFGKDKPPQAVQGYHFLGVQVLNREIFQFIPEGTESNILYDAVTAAIRNNRRVQIHKVNCEWFETGNLPDYLSATHTLLKNFQNKNPIYRPLFEFLKKVDPNSHLTELETGLLWADDSSALQETLVKDFAVIGKNCRISNSTLDNCVIGDGHSLESTQVVSGFIL